MENSGGIQASLAGRYATALFDLAREEKALDAVEKSLATLSAAVAEVGDLRRLVTSPVLSRAETGAGIAAAAKALKTDPLTTRFVGVLAANRRLDQLGVVATLFHTLAANQRGETTAAVTSAHPLTADQVKALKAQLKTRLGRDVTLDLSVDPAILGGLVVRIGSQMIDSSIRTRLNSLAHAMKG
ncbi:F0F1 ATP synthase subunit delta [Sphingomonas flavalba]|uniref:F0F1 ATP synthase subunit delta n=1 Tax=Sphingomonas flavalba TaxID=2559804 RepID=UPI0039E0D2FB